MFNLIVGKVFVFPIQEIDVNLDYLKVILKKWLGIFLIRDFIIADKSTQKLLCLIYTIQKTICNLINN
jgi:hypothetical protein